jgi:hypothetical protein
VIAVSKGGKNAQAEKRRGLKGRRCSSLSGRNEGADPFCDEIGGCVEGEVPRVQNMDLCSFHIPLVGSRLGDLE